MSKGQQTRAVILTEALRAASVEGFQGISIGMLADRLKTCLVLLLAPCPYGNVAAADLPPISYVASRFPPYTFELSGEAAGPTAALIAALAERVGRPAPLAVLPLARALAEAENQPNTLIALIARTAAREEQFHWVCPVLNYDVAVFRRRDRPDVAAEGLPDLARWRVAGRTDSRPHCRPGCRCGPNA